MNILCTVNARGGSKGVKNKNVRKINDIPLLAYTIVQAKKSGVFTTISVGSDSDEILNVGKEWGADYVIKRPLELANDAAPKIPAIRYCAAETEKLSGKEYDLIFDLDATAPLRTLEDIRNCANLLKEGKNSNILSGCVSRKSPYFNMVELNDKEVPSLSKKLDNMIFRRQDAPVVYDLNGSIYAWWKDKLFNHDTVFFDDTALYVMSPERGVDIDTEVDFQFVSFMISNRPDIQELFK